MQKHHCTRYQTNIANANIQMTKLYRAWRVRKLIRTGMPCVLARLCVKYGFGELDYVDFVVDAKKLIENASKACGKEKKGFGALMVFLLTCCNIYYVKDHPVLHSAIKQKLKQFMLERNGRFVWDSSLGEAPVNGICPLLSSWLSF